MKRASHINAAQTACIEFVARPSIDPNTQKFVDSLDVAFRYGPISLDEIRLLVAMSGLATYRVAKNMSASQLGQKAKRLGAFSPSLVSRKNSARCVVSFRKLEATADFLDTGETDRSGLTVEVGLIVASKYYKLFEQTSHRVPSHGQLRIGEDNVVYIAFGEWSARQRETIIEHLLKRVNTIRSECNSAPFQPLMDPDTEQDFVRGLESGRLTLASPARTHGARNSIRKRQAHSPAHFEFCMEAEALCEHLRSPVALMHNSSSDP